ncbi:MAG: ribosome maturation factor RimM [Bacillota bacterium]|nr:ribosome maturation factor RimM [Bacillota bacterium]MDD3297483.1 ribosome maturation factor RimM [Bacillota bacterium]MDD3850156.1 ribosome maturation factor RimM [Bacillota bacterium]MDD4706879.1 ribosome maturation factor RimM [Bacillota bacterium]
MDYYRIGYIANTLGLRGEMKVLLISNVPDRFEDLKDCFINSGNIRLPVEVERYRPYKKNCVALKLKGYDDANSVEALKGRYLEVDRANLAKLEEGHFYMFDIIGCKVFTTDGELLGEVEDVLSLGTNDLYVVKGERGEILIPAVKEMVKDIDIAKKTIRVQLPEGLVE